MTMNAARLVVVALCLAGCSGNGGGGTGGGSGTAGGTGTAGGSGTAGGGSGSSTVALTGTVRNTLGVGLSGATVQVLDASPANTATTNGTGQYSLTVPASTDLFIRASAANHKGTQTGHYATDAGTLNFTLISTTLFGQVATALNLTENPDAGLFNIDFAAATPLDGGFGASITLAHERTFTITAQGMPVFSDAGTAGTTGGELDFPNVSTGTTAVSPLPPAGYTCTVPRPAMQRVDPGVFTFVQAQCQ
jgi:hypothetical protein